MRAGDRNCPLEIWSPIDTSEGDPIVFNDRPSVNSVAPTGRSVQPRPAVHTEKRVSWTRPATVLSKWTGRGFYDALNPVVDSGLE